MSDNHATIEKALMKDMVGCIIRFWHSTKGGHVVAQLVEALCYKPEGHGFDFRWCHWNFSLTYSFWLHCGPRLTQSLTEMSM